MDFLNLQPPQTGQVCGINYFGLLAKVYLVDIERRKDLFLEAFSARSGYATPSSQTPLAVLVKRLQESLTRMESFDVVTTSPGSDGMGLPLYNISVLSLCRCKEIVNVSD
jgi:hypothetical protein